MNQSVVGSNTPQPKQAAASDPLHAMREPFPLPDSATLDSWNEGRVFAAWMQWG